MSLMHSRELIGRRRARTNRKKLAIDQKAPAPANLFVEIVVVRGFVDKHVGVARHVGNLSRVAGVAQNYHLAAGDRIADAVRRRYHGPVLQGHVVAALELHRVIAMRGQGDGG